jgi:hypothetical protein
VRGGEERRGLAVRGGWRDARWEECSWESNAAAAAILNSPLMGTIAVETAQTRRKAVFCLRI